MNELKEYVVTALRESNNNIFFDVFMACTEAEARSHFRNCYRHDNYKILSTAPTGRY